MSILDQIASGGTPPVNPLDTLGKLQSLRTGQMQQQGLALENQQRQQAMQDSQALTKAYQEWDGKDYSDLAHLAVKNGATGTSAMAIQKHALDQRKMYSDMAKTDSETGKNNLEMAAKQNDLVAGHIANLQNVPDDQLGQAVIQTAQQLSQARGYDGKPLLDPQHVQSAQQIAQMPPEQQRAALSMFQKDFMAQSQQMEQAKNQADIELKRAETREKGFTVPLSAPAAQVLGQPAGTMVPLAIEQKARETANTGMENATYDGKVRIVNKIDPNAPVRTLGTAPAVTTFNLQNGGMSQNALDMAAQQFAQTGQIPQGLGRNGVAGKQIMNRAAELYGKDLNPAAAHAIYQADTDSLKNLQKQFDAVSAFESTANKNINVLKSTLQNIPDLGTRFANVPARMVSDKVLGTEGMARYKTALATVQSESAKILNSANASGVLSDSARHELQDIVDGNATIPAMLGSLQTLQQDFGNRHESYAQQIADIQGRLRNSKGGNSAAGNNPSPNTSHKVGDVVKIGNKNIKISAIHADGTFDGSPVQ